MPPLAWENVRTNGTLVSVPAALSCGGRLGAVVALGVVATLFCDVVHPSAS